MPIKVQGGKEYKLVSERLKVFFENYESTIRTKIAYVGDRGIVMRAQVINKDGRVVSTGHATAPFTVDDKQVEKCETVAVGRSLAFLSAELMGSEIASADEMANFNFNQAEKKVMERYVAHADAFKRNWDSIVYIKQMFAEDKLSAALEAYNEISEADKIALRMAPTKGAVWTLDDARKMKQAQEEDFNPETGVYESIARKNDESV